LHGYIIINLRINDYMVRVIKCLELF